MLFNVSDFARATFEVNVDASLLNLTLGQSAVASIGGNLTISGMTIPVCFDVRVTGLKGGQ
ncbi:YceI family protein [Glaciecola sp. SC05]|uniref:YceI family protein n=1 Tax=Glaciecola sp. SC05 TaxID=1987355 RepID=UPI00352790CD